jgi:hypothetical protein
MPRIHVVKKAQARYEMTVKRNPDGSPVKVPVMTKRRDEQGNLIQKTKKGGALVFRTISEPDKSKPKPNRKCDKCGKEIDVGMPYQWTEIKMTYGGMKKVRCMDCPPWKQSELTTSKMSGVYAAQEEAEDTDVSTIEDLEALCESVAEQIEAVGDEYEESGQNMEDGFEHATSMSDELKERGESLKSWAEDIRALDFDEVPDCDECAGVGTVECTNCEGNGVVQSESGGETEDCPDCEGNGTVNCEACDGEGKPGDDSEQYTEFITEQKDKLIEAMGECPV